MASHLQITSGVGESQDFQLFPHFGMLLPLHTAQLE